MPSLLIGLDNYWLGISDAVNEGEWRTDKGDLQTYFNWATVDNWVQPDDYGNGQHYVVTGGYYAPDGTWDDTYSTSERSLLCTYIV